MQQAHIRVDQLRWKSNGCGETPRRAWVCFNPVTQAVATNHPAVTWRG